MDTTLLIDHAVDERDTYGRWGVHHYTPRVLRLPLEVLASFHVPVEGGVVMWVGVVELAAIEVDRHLRCERGVCTVLGHREHHVWCVLPATSHTVLGVLVVEATEVQYVCHLGV